MAANPNGICSNLSNYLDGHQKALCCIFGILSAINIIFPAVLSPIIFYDSKKYINIAQHFLSNGFNPNMCLIEVVPGYPLLLSGLVECFGSALGIGPILGMLQGTLLVISYVFAAGIVYEITGSAGLALTTACISSLSLDMTYNAAAVFTEPCFIFFLSGGFFMMVRSFRRDSLWLFFGGMCFFLCSAWFRSTIHPLLVFPVIFFICKRLTACFRMHGRLLIKDVLSNVIVAFAAFAISFIALHPLETDDLGFSEKLSASWARAIQFSPSGQKLFKQQYRDTYMDMKGWVESGATKPNLSKSRESLLPFASLPQDEWTKFYQSNPRKQLLWWRSPWYFRMAMYGDTEQEAYRWAGRIGVNILSNNIINALEETVTTDIKYALAKPLRAANRSISNYTDNNVLFSKNFAQFSKRLATMISTMESINIFLVFHLMILAGIILGIYIYHSSDYVAFATLLLGIFFINVFIAGKLPRYFAHVLPYSGFALLIVFQTMTKFLESFRKTLKE